MKLYIVIATKGRAALVGQLCQHLQQQTLPAAAIVVVGAGPEDVAGLQPLPQALAVNPAAPVSVRVTGQPGSCAQRNEGIEWVLALRRHDPAAADRTPWAVVFLDDDFWPGSQWLQQCADALQRRPGASGLTGRLLGDGAQLSRGLSVDDAADLLSGRRPALPHWHGGTEPGVAGCGYGCNMAFVGAVIEQQRFDENLPLYGWQEDLDYSARAQALGPILYEPGCVGVHLGVKGGRTSGLRFGYSQIANPWYLIRKGTMRTPRALRFVTRHLLSNTVRGLRSNPGIDYRGRLRGNLLAMADLLRGRCHPRRIEGLS